ncbi:MAG: GNAT family N-acetyltransferase [Xanthobacteraceae bacterium]
MSISRQAGFSAELVASERQIPVDLWAACFPPAVEGHWWYRLLEHSGLEQQFQIFYAVLRYDGRPVGIAPMFTMELPLEFVVPPAARPFLSLLGNALPSLSRPRILFIGSPCSDEGAIGLLPDANRARALDCVQQAAEDEARKRSATMVIWKDFPSAWQADLAGLAQRFALFTMASFPGAIVRVPSSQKSDYFAGMRAQRRYNLRRKLRQSEQNFPAEVEVVQEPDDVTLDRIYALFLQTRERATTTFEEFDRRFFETAARASISHFILLREPGTREIVAFMLCFDLGDLVINKYIGIDYARPREWFLYFRLFDVALDWALARGARALQSGQTGYSAKFEQGHQLVPLTLYGKHRNRLWHWLCSLVVRQIRWDTLDEDLAEYVRAHPEAK